MTLIFRPGRGGAVELELFKADLAGDFFGDVGAASTGGRLDPPLKADRSFGGDDGG